MRPAIDTVSAWLRAISAWISFQECPMTKARSSADSSAPRRRTASTTDSTFSRSESTRVPSRSKRIASGLTAAFLHREGDDFDFRYGLHLPLEGFRGDGEFVGIQRTAGHWSPVDAPSDTKIEVDGVSFDALLGRVGAGAREMVLAATQAVVKRFGDRGSCILVAQGARV